jgi:tripartite-type tricarboxylate transporter receptor subunit TctC
MGGVLVVFLATSPVAAFPDKPITVNVCQPAGGGTDRNLQTLVPFAERHLGQSFIVQYRAGAGGTLAMQEIKAAPKDGHTLVFCDTGGSLFGPIAQNIAFKPDDVIPIAQVTDVPWVFTVHASTPYKTVQDVIDAAKKVPGQLKASIADIASADHYNWLLFARAQRARPAGLPLDSLRRRRAKGSRHAGGREPARHAAAVVDYGADEERHHAPARRGRTGAAEGAARRSDLP